jgi:hypothetical protein
MKTNVRECIMADYQLVCGEAFEDLSYNEMLDYDGGTGLLCSVISASVFLVTLFGFPKKAY